MTKLYTPFCSVTVTANLYSRCEDFGEAFSFFFFFFFAELHGKKYRLIHFVVISHEVVPTDTSTIRKHKVPIKLVVLRGLNRLVSDVQSIVFVSDFFLTPTCIVL